MDNITEFLSAPDVRDGLDRKERIILYCLYELQKEYGEKKIPTIMLFGRVCEMIEIGKDEFQAIVSRFARN